MFRRIARRLLRCVQLFLLLFVLYVLIVLVGLLPVNNDFQPTEDGVEIMVTSTAIHADFVLPIRNETIDWSRHLPLSDFAGDVSNATHVAFGWGNMEFYIDTPTWADLKAKTVLRALFWASKACMHVIVLDEEPVHEGVRKTRLSDSQYRRLVDHILDSFCRDDEGGFLLIEGAAYESNDAFYYAHGSYHAFNTCNCWIGRGLRSAGVRSGWFTPLPKTVSLYMD